MKITLLHLNKEEILKNKDLIVNSLIEIENTSYNEGLKEHEIKYELIENPVSEFIIAIDKENSDKIVGYLDFWITFDSATVFKITVLDTYRKLGIGTMLINKSLEILKENEVLYYTLEVRESNTNAINLYKKCGFKEIVKKDKYYKDGEDAIYMVKGIYE